MRATLQCTVRGCRRDLVEEPSGAACAGGHHFDRAREGYLSLLQPTDRRAPAPGDERTVAQARRRLAELGHDDNLCATLLPWVAGAPQGAALDVGCGEGTLLARLTALTDRSGAGVDLSAPSVALAARQAPQHQWVVANADRGLPWQAGGFAVVLSIVARLPGAELLRVLAPGGRVIVAVSGDQDLAEVRELALGGVVAKGRLDRAVERLGEFFEVHATLSSRQMLTLDSSGLADLLTASYLGGRHGRVERLAAVESLDVTIARDIAILVPRHPPEV